MAGKKDGSEGGYITPNPVTCIDTLSQSCDVSSKAYYRDY